MAGCNYIHLIATWHLPLRDRRIRRIQLEILHDGYIGRPRKQQNPGLRRGRLQSQCNVHGKFKFPFDLCYILKKGKGNCSPILQTSSSSQDHPTCTLLMLRTSPGYIQVNEVSKVEGESLETECRKPCRSPSCSSAKQTNP